MTTYEYSVVHCPKEKKKITKEFLNKKKKSKSNIAY